MKNITLSAEEELIERARRKAAAGNTTLNALFREWLASYAGAAAPTREELERIADSFSHFRLGKPLTREERSARR